MAKLPAFLKTFEKQLEDIDGVGTSSLPPRYWYSTGNFVLNKILSGSFYKGIPQGRITNLSGASATGKSFLAANLIRSAQQAGAIVFVIDTENALDDQFMRNIGVDPDREDYFYADVTTIEQVTAVVSKFLKGYKAEYGSAVDAPQVLIVIDSLDMLMTPTELEHYDKGIQKGDQGQRNKQLKAMLRTFVQDIKSLNVAMVVTSQVYKNQDVLNGEGLWIVSDAVKYSASQIALLTKLKLKDKSEGKSEVVGVRITAEGYKTRFTKPFQKVIIEVPYESGMDPYSGLLETGLAMGLVEKKGSWYTLTGQEDKWRASDIASVAETILLGGEAQSQTFLSVTQAADAEVEVDTDAEETTADATARRKAKAAKTKVAKR